MAKASIADITAQGWNAHQFGDPADFTTDPDGYLDTILQAVAVEVEARVGASVYANADPSASALSDKRNYHAIRRAEVSLVNAELYRRREAFEDANIELARVTEGGQTIGSRFLEDARKAEERADDLLGQVTGAYPGSAVSVGHVQSGPYPDTEV